MGRAKDRPRDGSVSCRSSRVKPCESRERHGDQSHLRGGKRLAVQLATLVLVELIMTILLPAVNSLNRQNATRLTEENCRLPAPDRRRAEKLSRLRLPVGV